jgi:hypothetical protein
LVELAWVGNSNTFQIVCNRLSSPPFWQSRNPITQLFRFIRPARRISSSRKLFQPRCSRQNPRPTSRIAQQA